MEDNCVEAEVETEAVNRDTPSVAKPREEVGNGKVSPSERADSPDSNCPICLGKLQNKSFTDGCLHQFCFTCLLEWSKVKAECPLCKQGFESIIHNVRSIEDYDQYHLRQHEPRLSIHEIQQITFPLPRFRYRTTLVSNHQPFYGYLHRLGQMMSQRDMIPPDFLMAGPPTHRRPHAAAAAASWRHLHHHHHHHHQPTSTTSGTSSGGRRGATVAGDNHILPGTSAFRRNIYNNQLWVRRLPDLTGRFRECSAEFFLNNPAQVHRLVPWLNRELNVLLADSPDHQMQDVLAVVLELLPRCNIRSRQFRTAIQPMLGPMTEHFVHELYAFGTSPYDMVGYDRVCLYGPRFNYDPTTADDDTQSSDSDVQVVEVVTSPSNGMAESMAGPSCRAAIGGAASCRAATGGATALMAITSLSDSNSSDCEIVGVVKPRHLRTPEIITLDDDSSDDCLAGVTMVDCEAATAPLLEAEMDQEEMKPNVNAYSGSVCRTEPVTRWTRDTLKRPNRGDTTNSDSDDSGNWSRNFYSNRSPLKHHAYFNASSLSSTDCGVSSGEEWGSRKTTTRRHKRGKRRRGSAAATTEKREKDAAKKRKVKKERQPKPVKHWKKKLCKKLESSSSSDQGPKVHHHSTHKKRKNVESGSSSHDSNGYMSPAEPERRKVLPRLRSVVHVKRNTPAAVHADSGPSTSTGASTSNGRVSFQRHQRPRSWSISSSSSSEYSPAKKQTYRKMKSKSCHL